MMSKLFLSTVLFIMPAFAGGPLYSQQTLRVKKSAEELLSPFLPPVIQATQRLLAEGHHMDWIFCDTKGGALRKSNFRKNNFIPAVKRADLPPIRFHDLRHTAATILLSQGVHPKVVQERLGHAQIAMTLDIYSHVLPSMQHEAAQKLNASFEIVI